MNKKIILLGIICILFVSGCSEEEKSWEEIKKNIDEACKINNGITIDGECNYVWKITFDGVNITHIKTIYEEDFSEIEDNHDRLLKVKCMENKTCYHFASYEAFVQVGNTKIYCYVINNTKYSTIPDYITSEELKKQFPRVKIKEGCFRDELYNIDRYGLCMENYRICELI